MSYPWTFTKPQITKGLYLYVITAISFVTDIVWLLLSKFKWLTYAHMHFFHVVFASYLFFYISHKTRTFKPLYSSSFHQDLTFSYGEQLSKRLSLCKYFCSGSLCKYNSSQSFLKWFFFYSDESSKWFLQPCQKCSHRLHIFNKVS